MTLGARIHAVVVRDLVAKRARRNAPNHHVRWLVALRVAEELNHERVQRQQATRVSGWVEWDANQHTAGHRPPHCNTAFPHSQSHLWYTCRINGLHM